jgi:cytochrome c-type biogenesis protein CcmH
MLWGLFALLTGAAILAILWPLARKPRAEIAGAAPDVAFYQAQLDEIARETASDLLSPQEAATARTEAARRLLHATEDHPAPDKGVAPSQLRLRLVALIALILVPAISLGLYAMLGHPTWPDAPLTARQEAPSPNMSVAAAIAQIETHLLSHPDDGRGYEVLVPAYLGAGRIDDAVRAAALSLQKLGPTPEREAVYGETLVYAANGVVTEEARKLFARAAQGEPPPPLKALFFLGLAAAQDNDKPHALVYWRELLTLLPQDAPFRADLEARIAALDTKPPPASGEAAAIAALPPAARAAAIHAMIDRLAARLAQNGHDIDGWLRLVRAYKVVNEIDKARAALATARRDFNGEPKALTRIDALARELGLDS